MVLCMALVMHILGYGLVCLVWSSGLELGKTLPATIVRIPLLTNPYDMAVALATGSADKPTALSVFVFIMTIAFESLTAWMLMASRGLDIVLDSADVRSQGWVFEHIVRPSRHGYKPLAFVLTNSIQGEYAIGYKGIVAEVRQGENGELKLLSLADPQSFVYHIATTGTKSKKIDPAVEIHDGKWIGGVLLLESSVIRNVVIHNIPADLVDQLKADLSDEPNEIAPNSDGASTEESAA